MMERLPLLRRRSPVQDELATPSRDGDGPDRSRRRRAAPLALGAGVVAVGALAAVTLLGGEGGDGRQASGRGGSTVAVSRQTLVSRETVDGTLGYAGSRTVINRLGGSGGSPTGDGSSGEGADPGASDAAASDGSDSSGDGSYTGSGTVTALARPGSVVERGGVLYRLDGEPIVLMYGSTPAYRTLASGVSDGRDVRQLEQNLAELGFDPGTVDETFTFSTAAAVSSWQESVGLPVTGSVELGRVVFLPGSRRIGERKVEVGDVLGAGSEVLDTSSTKRVVTVELDASLQSMARKGEPVEVTLPDNSTVRGRITEVGRVAREVDDGTGSDLPTGGSGGEQELVIDVTVELRSKRGIGRLDEAPVGVGLAQESRKDVLAVPVDALVARRGGGYGVELADGRRIAPVHTGLFADGYVEVTGEGIRDGTRVVVPSE